MSGKRWSFHRDVQLTLHATPQDNKDVCYTAELDEIPSDTNARFHGFK